MFPPVQREIKTGALQGRAVSIRPLTVRQAGTWDKICLLFRQAIQWVKDLFAPAKKPSAIDRPVETIKAPLPDMIPPDLTFLRPKDPGYNLKRLSELSLANAVQSVSSEEAYKTVPRQNPIRLGYDDSVQYQTELGDRFVAMQAGAAALGILGISLGTMFRLGASDSYDKFPHCVESAARVWQNTPGKTALAAAALFLAAGFYANRKGWLGAYLHDHSMGWRSTQVKILFRDAAKELAQMAKTKPQDAEKLSVRILQNSELIESTLHVDLQLPDQKAKAIADVLKTACQEALHKDLADPAKPESIHSTAGKTP